MISPIENSGMILRTQDFTAIKQQEDLKLSGNEVHVRQEISEQGNENVRTVHESGDSDRPDTHHDAREEGRNKYYNNRQDNKKKKPVSDGIVRVKNQGGFDLKI